MDKYTKDWQCSSSSPKLMFQTMARSWQRLKTEEKDRKRRQEPHWRKGWQLQPAALDGPACSDGGWKWRPAELHVAAVVEVLEDGGFKDETEQRGTRPALLQSARQNEGDEAGSFKRPRSTATRRAGTAAQGRLRRSTPVAAAAQGAE
jgi:hypothetical protein